MKHIISTFFTIVLLISLVSCDAPGVYKIDDDLPPIINSETQYPYILSVDVTDEITGNTVTLVSSSDIDTIHMKFEGIKCTKNDSVSSDSCVYTVSFNTDTDSFSIGVISETELIINSTGYEAMRGGADMMYLAGLFN